MELFNVRGVSLSERENSELDSSGGETLKSIILHIKMVKMVNVYVRLILLQ